MPIVNIDLKWLGQLLGKDLPPDVVQESLDQIGCDVEEIIAIKRSHCSQCQSLVEHPVGQDEVRGCNFCGFEAEEPFALAGERQVLRLDLLADRPDLFDVGGLARALRGTLGIEAGLPNYPTSSSGITVTVDAAVTKPSCLRPAIACAAMTLPPVDETSLVAIMKLQENLHWGIGRDRKLASIGVYDRDTIGNKINYTTIDPDSDKFVPLGMPGKEMSGREILESHPKGTAYAHLLEAHSRYPALIDEQGQVLSMPPIINSEETRLRIGTTRVFVDVTGISKAAVDKSLLTLVCSLAEMGGKIETISLLHADGQSEELPELTPGEADVDLQEAQRWLGLPLDEESLRGAFRKMRLDMLDSPDADAGSGRYVVRYPSYRTDIRHMVDLMEDVAIGYGYANIEPRLVRSMTVGKPRPEEEVSGRVRQLLLGFGYTEIMSLPLTTEEKQFHRLRRSLPESYVQISNPKLKDYCVVRQHLLSGLLDALHENRRRAMPLRLFEVDNVVELDPQNETGTTETRRVAWVEIGKESGYAKVRAVLDSIFRELGYQAEYDTSDDPIFVPGRGASFGVDAEISGIIGELHPEILVEYNLTHPAAIVEMTLHRIF